MSRARIPEPTAKTLRVAAASLGSKWSVGLVVEALVDEVLRRDGCAAFSDVDSNGVAIAEIIAKRRKKEATKTIKS